MGGRIGWPTTACAHNKRTSFDAAAVLSAEGCCASQISSWKGTRPGSRHLAHSWSCSSSALVCSHYLTIFHVPSTCPVPVLANLLSGWCTVRSGVLVASTQAGRIFFFSSVLQNAATRRHRGYPFPPPPLPPSRRTHNYAHWCVVRLFVVPKNVSHFLQPIRSPAGAFRRRRIFETTINVIVRLCKITKLYSVLWGVNER